jgi:hypothetical protein
MWEEKVRFYDKLIATCPDIERKGKTVPHTSANGCMFTLLNKEGEIGIRLSNEAGEKFIEEHQTARYKSHGHFMNGYVLIPEKLYDNMELLTVSMKESHA